PSWLYYDRAFNERVYQMPRIFPLDQPSAENRVIMLASPGGKVAFCALMSPALPSLQVADIGGSQCFPRWLYSDAAGAPEGELALSEGKQQGLVRRDAITDAGLEHFQAAYLGSHITKDDLFHYVYGLLHSPDYRERFADNLSKELPRIPAVTRYEDFRAFVEAGQRLGDLHC